MPLTCAWAKLINYKNAAQLALMKRVDLVMVK
jgi:hypothetical protein